MSKTDRNQRLLAAAHKGDAFQVRFLIEIGAEVDTTDNWGHTPLMIASVNGHESVVRLLVKEGARVDAVVQTGLDRGLTASDMAKRAWQSEVALLLDKGLAVA